MSSNPAAAVAVFDLAKSFGATIALSGVDLSVRRGEVVALMGANGAGKSTLVKILSGSETPDAGRIEIGGVRVDVRSPQHAKALGIATVHQQTGQAGAPGLTVAENLLLDAFCDGRNGFWTRPATIRRRAAAIAGLLGVELPLDRDFAEISTAQKQLVAIARAVAAQSSVLILDEPTSTLSAAESQHLFGIIGQVRSAGMAVLYISHRIADLSRIADRVVILRGGQVARELEKPIDFRAAVSAMIGRPIESARPTHRAAAGEPVLSLGQIRLLPQTEPFDLEVGRGEVVAITGALGSGKSRLLRGLYGLEPFAGGSAMLDGRAYASTGPADSIARGVVMMAEDRWRSSIFPATTLSGTIAGTISFPYLWRWFPSGVVRPGRERAVANGAIGRLGIRAQGPDDLLEHLSGGNQQKVVLARWQAEPSRLLLLDEPFQGVDVGARADIIAAVRGGLDGSAVLLATSDDEEALEVADRILVMQDHVLRPVDAPHGGPAPDWTHTGKQAGAQDD